MMIAPASKAMLLSLTETPCEQVSFVIILKFLARFFAVVMLAGMQSVCISNNSFYKRIENCKNTEKEIHFYC